MSKKQNYRGLEHHVLSEEDVKLYVLERFNDIKKEKRIRDLISFHSKNKFMIMAHDQEQLKKLGNIVASFKKIPLEDILDYYEKHLLISLKNSPTVQKHSNVILHIFGFFFKNLDQQEKNLFLDILGKYKKEKITLGKILLEIDSLVFRFNNTYLANQTYFLLYADSQPNFFLNFEK